MSHNLSAFWQVLQSVPQAYPVLRALVMCETPFQLKREMAETSQESFWSSQFVFLDERHVYLSDRGSERGSPFASLPWYFQVCLRACVQMHVAVGELRVDSVHFQPEGTAFW